MPEQAEGGKAQGPGEKRQPLSRSGTGSPLPPNLKPTTHDAQRELVARADSLDLLAEHRRRAAAGHGRIVLISGEAGVGKSTLLRAFEADLTGGRATYASARCVEFIQTPLGPLRELLESIDRNSSGPRDPGARALFERLTFERDAATTIALPPGWLLETIDAAFARSAQRGTIVLSIEDVHWADRSTLNFLSYLADRIAGRRMLVLATYRSNELGGNHPRLADFATLLQKESVSQVALEPLDERSTHTLIELALPYPDALDPATVADIVRRSQGNPFFAEELLKSALARKTPGGQRQLPLSIRGAVLARAALLSDDERKILSLAAVLGERFSIDRLVALWDGPRDDVLLALERAQSLQLVGAERTAPGELTFRHALTQEVLYGELLAERVRPLHEAIGLELESRPDHSAVSVELAHHWWRAGDRERAALYAELAGDRSFGIGALADAISYYERALAERKGTDGTVAGLHHKIGLALGSLGRLAGGVRRLRRAGEIYWNADDFEGFASNASALGAQLHNSGDTAGAIDVFRQTIDTLEGKLPAATLDLLRARMSYDCVAALDFTSALALLSDVQEPIADRATATHAYQARFKVAAMHGDLEAWRDYTERALEAATLVTDDGYRLYQTHCQVALDALGLGELDRAREQFAAAISLEPGRNFSMRSLAYAASALEHTLRGEFQTAASLLSKPATAHEESYPILVHVKSAQLTLGICAGDDARLHSDGAESLVRYGVDRGMKLAIGLLGGPYAWALGLRGESEEAARLIHRVAKVVPGPHRFLFAFLAAAQFGNRTDVFAMRRQLAEAAARPHDRVNKAALGLFDAFAARRGIGTNDTRAGALDAAAGFEQIGWPWLAALGYELGGESKRSLDIYRTLGALRDLRRMEIHRTQDTAVLSPREREVAELVAKGNSNDEVAQLLHISPRTVEKHVSSALEKLNLRSRVQLGRLLK
jgi:DNA-binding CsgD family transcriptional regulator